MECQALIFLAAQNMFFYEKILRESEGKLTYCFYIIFIFLLFVFSQPRCALFVTEGYFFPVMFFLTFETNRLNKAYSQALARA
mgnify:CR=1 FL=1